MAFFIFKSFIKASNCAFSPSLIACVTFSCSFLCFIRCVTIAPIPVATATNGIALRARVKTPPAAATFIKPRLTAAIKTGKPFAAKAIPAITAAAPAIGEFIKLLAAFISSVNPFVVAIKAGSNVLPNVSEKSRKASPKESTLPANPSAAA